MTQGVWQPIETAPKDETWVLLWFPDDCPAPEPVVRAGFWSLEFHDWYGSEAASRSLTELCGSPSYWTPLVFPIGEKGDHNG